MSRMLHGCFADTEYAEITAKSGHRYGVWVTTPPGYADSTDPLPLIYVLDANWTLGLTAPLIVIQGDPYLTIAPYIQVSVGYARRVGGSSAAASGVVTWGVGLDFPKWRRPDRDTFTSSSRGDRGNRSRSATSG